MKRFVKRMLNLNGHIKCCSMWPTLCLIRWKFLSHPNLFFVSESVVELVQVLLLEFLVDLNGGWKTDVGNDDKGGDVNVY